MPQADGIEVLRRLADDKCRAGILVVSGADSRVLGSAERLGANRGLNMLGAMQKELLSNVVYSKLALGGFPAVDCAFINTVDELHAGNHISELPEST